MKLQFGISIGLLLLIVGCKKDYTCDCFNPGGIYATYEIHDSKKKAQEKCAEYFEESNPIPFSESACQLK